MRRERKRAWQGRVLPRERRGEEKRVEEKKKKRGEMTSEARWCREGRGEVGCCRA